MQRSNAVVEQRDGSGLDQLTSGNQFGFRRRILDSATDDQRIADFRACKVNRSHHTDRPTRVVVHGQVMEPRLHHSRNCCPDGRVMRQGLARNRHHVANRSIDRHHTGDHTFAEIIVGHDAEPVRSIDECTGVARVGDLLCDIADSIVRMHPDDRSHVLGDRVM